MYHKWTVDLRKKKPESKVTETETQVNEMWLD